MARTKKEENLNLTKVAVTSRRSGKLGMNDFFTFECVLESDVNGLKPVEVEERLHSLWTKANYEVDKQFEDTLSDLNKD